ncbi:Na_-driven multidrug efflux pump [Hexamita inflata]|uniref:Na -driven multidrug efflux pump n=1 Tax=Hexamita inflata TaxID=28002 RepID=A0AA86N8V9_9EUKA|nr:Na -driven multidrug efflux pump [Hexamita inflata]
MKHPHQLETPEEKLRKLGQTPIFKLLLQQSIPNVVSLLSLSMYQIIDSIFIGNYIGEVGLAAQAIFSAIEYLSCTSLPVAFSIGAVALIGPALGKNDLKGANIFLTQYLYFVIFYVVLVPVVFVPFLTPFLMWLGCAEGEMLRLAKQYALVMLLVGPLVYSPNGGFLPLFRVENRAMTAMFVQVSSSILTLVFDSILFPVWYKQLELYAAAFSTVFALTVTGTYTVLNYMGCFKKSVLKFAGKVKPDLKTIGIIAYQSFPQFLNALPNQMGVLLANMMIKKYSASAEQAERLNASVGLYTRLSMLVLQPRQAIYLGFVSILGFNVGAKMWERVLKLLKYTFWLIIGVVSFMTAVEMIFAQQLASLFTKSPEFIVTSAKSLQMALFGYPLGGALMICSGVYQMERRPALASVFQGMRLVLMVVLMFVMPLIMDIEYIFLALGLTDAIVGVIGVICFWMIYYKYKKIEQKSKTENLTSEAVKVEITQPVTVAADMLHGD